MKHNLLPFLFFVFFAFHSFGQQTQTLVIEFKKDDHSLSVKERAKLDSTVQSLRDATLGSIQLSGHTDNDGSDAYNIDLSKRRNQSVVDFLVSRQISKEIIHTTYFGENQPKDKNTTKMGQQRNRRVEITIAYSIAVKETVAEEVPEKKEDCTEDTTIVFPKGTLVKVNKCDFLRNPNCYKIQEYLDANSLRAENIETMTEHGEQLVSGGMLKYDICEGKKITCYVPLSTTCDNEGMDLWERKKDGTWKKVSKSPLKTEVINNVRYYPLTLSGNGFCNLDKIPPFDLNKIKFKVKKGMELYNVSISCDCQMYRTSAVPKNKRKRKVVIGTLCCENPMVSVFASTKTGENYRSNTGR